METKKQTKAGFTPTPSQAEAIEKLQGFFACEESWEFSLTGFAGTGKTTVIQIAIAHAEGRVAMAAPTHKAVGVLSEMAAERGMQGTRIETIHRMLSLKKSYNDGKVEFVPDPKRVPMVESYDVLIVDECSMIDAAMYELIRPYIDGERVKVVWMGDALQLPPVGDEKDSPTFEADAGHSLTEVVRNGGVIGEAIAAIRDNIEAETPELPSPARDELGAIELYGNRMWFQKFLQDLENTDDDIQALAFTNRAVDWINAHVRKHFFGADAAPFVSGERLVAIETFEQCGQVCMYTGQRFDVREAVEGREIFYLTKSDGSVEKLELECWELEVEFPNGRIDIIPVLDDSQKTAWKKALSEAKSNALNNRSLWGEYYELKERFARVRPGYATTVHKSQGSTYDRVYLAQSDILTSASFDPVLRNRLLYVGYSRTRSGLILC